MALKKQRTPKRWRSKEARDIVRAVTGAGGTVERTANGHLKITGPKGVAVVASAPDTGHQGGRALANTWATITDKTGLFFPAENAGSPGKEVRTGKRRAGDPRGPAPSRDGSLAIRMASSRARTVAPGLCPGTACLKERWSCPRERRLPSGVP